MSNRNFLFAGLVLVFAALVLKLFNVGWYYYGLIAGILLKVVYLISGLLDGTLAGGRYLAMLLMGIAVVGIGGYLKSATATPIIGSWIMGAGFALKAISIVLMVVVGRKRRLSTKKLVSE
jgi:hypothetical protein